MIAGNEPQKGPLFQLLTVVLYRSLISACYFILDSQTVIFDLPFRHQNDKFKFLSFETTSERAADRFRFSHFKKLIKFPSLPAMQLYHEKIDKLARIGLRFTILVKWRIFQN